MKFSMPLSCRVVAADAIITQCYYLTRGWTKQGFHPGMGATPLPRTLTPSELAMFQAALRFLRAGFSDELPKPPTHEALRRRRFNDFVFAAIEFCDRYQRHTVAYDIGDQTTAFGDEVPPLPEPRRVTQLEEETYAAACAYLGRVLDLDIPIDEECPVMAVYPESPDPDVVEVDE